MSGTHHVMRKVIAVAVIAVPVVLGIIVDKDKAASSRYGFGEDETGGYGADEQHHHYDVKYYDDGGDDNHHHHHHHYKPHDPSYHKALAIKGLLIPLAGVALLGAAAAFVSNPILLQLGVISSTYGRRRRRRDTAPTPDRYRDFKLLERFVSQVPREEMQEREKKLFADYLSCSGAGSCLERLACELQSSDAASMPVETNVMAAITREIFDNGYVPRGVKTRMTEAMKRGQAGSSCAVYHCRHFGKLTNTKTTINHLTN